ncbi:protein kinase [Bradyrhizobium ontarionense]|uniref:Protein kinase n=1 Tax=Bradyrhizobium ontarionense TaxID=2898149 RepID=A0ABY3RER9_9BRAD|nr:protein kinase [Bradyrhizobium sp. A19]UFZ05502.1 protein kinase [Bradyrhizobium sp. A19]
MTDVRYTFLARPETRLATVFKGTLAGRRVEDTVILDRTVLAAPAPTIIRPRTGPAADAAGAPRHAPRPAAFSDLATIVAGRSETRSTDDHRPLVRKSLPPGCIVHRYRINKVIGEGGFGITYLAEDTVIRRRVALKELFLSGRSYRTHANDVRCPDGDDGIMQWSLFYFSEEARITFALRHEGIVRIHDFFRTNNTAYIVYELLDGSDMRLWGDAARRSLGHGEVLDLMRATCDALDHVHASGFVHRDLKPGNIFVVGPRRLPVLIDFGAATARDVAGHDGGLMVTPGFSPPEQYRTDALPDVRSDVYALCASFYWLLSGEAPPEATQRLVSDNLQPLAAAIDPAFRFSDRLYRVIGQGLSLDPSQRYDSVARLLDDLVPKTTLAATGYAPQPRGARIFLSYRRAESPHFAGRLLDALQMRFGTDAVFLDAHSIPPGTDFWDHIKDVLGDCAIQLVLIGPAWTRLLHARRRRWYQRESREDHVVQEIAAAIELGLPILPVLFDGAAMPRPKDLPPALRLLPGLNASLVGSADSFRLAVDGLCDHIAHLRAAHDVRRTTIRALGSAFPPDYALSAGSFATVLAPPPPTAPKTPTSGAAFRGSGIVGG